MFALPIGYPQTGPDNFFVEVDLRLANGSPPPAFNPNRGFKWWTCANSWGMGLVFMTSGSLAAGSKVTDGDNLLRCL